MKSIFKGLALAACLLGCAACQRERELTPGGASSSITVSARVEGMSRSLAGADDSVIRDLNVYAYRDGTLAGTAYGRGGELSLSVPQGYTYQIYALANVGEMKAPETESDLMSWRVALPAAAYAAAGLPMASRHGTALRAERPSATLHLTLERLVSKVCLTLEKNLSRTDFQVTGVQILQAASDVTPFAPGSRALSVEDGDAASAEDVAALNRGEEVCFYVPENRGGVLLPGNLDQWGKVPSQIGGMAQLCTYMQVWGAWSTPGASADVAYRMYLGRDNCSDFSVEGNTESLLTLSLTDEGVFTASWKVEMRNFQDSRRLRFSSPSLTLSQGGGTAQTCIVAEPEDIDFQLYADTGQWEDAQMTYRRNRLQLQVQTAYVGTQEKTARLYLRSWDGLLTDTLTVTVPYVDGLFDDFTYSMPRYIAEWGSFRFPGASSSAPVRFALAGRTFAVYPGAPRWNFHDDSVGLSFVYDGQTTVWVEAGNFPTVDDASCTLTLGCGSLNRTLSLYPGTVPRYGFSEGLVLSECGNLNRDGGGWYDREADLHLLDEDDEVLDFTRFATPDAVLSLRGQALNDRNRYQSLYEAYSSAMWGEFSEDGYAGASMTFLEDALDDLLPENSLARFRLWGLRAEGDRTAELQFNIVNDGLLHMYQEAVPLRVLPAFPAQRYLGQYENRQVAPGDLRAPSVALDFTRGGNNVPAAREVSWTLYAALFDPADPPGPGMMDPSSKRCNNVRFDGARLQFSYDRLVGDPLCAGGYGIAGRTVNPHSGRVIQGWYTFDVVLYLSVGASVANLSETVAGYSFVPFCEYTAPYDSDLWNDALPPIPVKSLQEDGTTVYTTVRVPERVSGHACSMSLNGHYDIAGHSTAYNCYYFYYFTNWQYFGEFSFYVDGRETTTLDLDRAGFAATTQFNTPDYVRGAMGYYRLCRQRDIANLPDNGTNGLSNYLVEAAF